MHPRDTSKQYKKYSKEKVSGHASRIATQELKEILVRTSYTQHCVGITHAADLGIQTRVIERQNFTTRHDHDRAIHDAIKSSSIDYVFLAGYMAILGADFTTAFAGRLINIHPSLLPDFKGLGTHQRATDTRQRARRVR